MNKELKECQRIRFRKYTLDPFDANTQHRHYYVSSIIPRDCVENFKWNLLQDYLIATKQYVYCIDLY